MACRYYDDALIQKILKWIPQNSNLRVLRPDETKRLLELYADDKKDANVKLPLIALSRSKDIELTSNIKQLKSFDGLHFLSTKVSTAQINVIPIKISYQLDIYTKTYEEGDEYLREFLFKLINNPTIYITIPYNNAPALKHIANIRILDTVSDTSDISERLFAGQFTRWTIQMEIQDAYLFSVPYKNNWYIGGVELGLNDSLANPTNTDQVEYVADIDIKSN